MDQKDVSVAAVMTAPRYECVAARNQIEKSLRKLGIPLAISGGVYYHQCMESMLEQICDQSIDYVLTVDFDSVFLAEHVQRLLNIIVQEDDIDALAALQPMRGKGRVLGAKAGSSVVEWTGEPIEVQSAHFGLTVLDVQKIRETPKPWFFGKPDDRGGWSKECIDADVWFWQQWAEAGHKVFLDPGTRLGHLEELVTYFDSEMQLQHCYFSAWEKLSETTVDS